MSFSFQTEIKNISILLDNYIPDELPDDLFRELINIKNTIKILDNIYQGEYNNIYSIDEDTKLIKNVNVKKGHTPEYIYNDGTEPIHYFDYKNNTRYREMSLPNLTFFIAFIYNSLLIFDTFYTKLYSNLNDDSSNTPIIWTTKEGVIFTYFKYDEFIIEDSPELTTTFIGEEEKNKLFDNNILNDIKSEGTSLYYLETDIENFFKSIYTHDLSSLHNLLQEEDLQLKLKNKIYFEFLDYYNMKINKNHTKGILTGTISSRISSELLLLSIDRTIKDNIKDDITYKRYVDDMWFYSDNVSSLETFKNKLQEILREINLEIQHEKTNLSKNIRTRKTGNISKVFNDFSFLTLDNYEFKVTDLLYINSLISKDKLDLSYWKSFLSILTKKIDKLDLIIDNSIIEGFLVMFIKFGFLHNPLQTRIYKLIDKIKNSNEEHLDIIHKVLQNSSKQINNYFNDTIGQIWHYKLLLCSMDSEIRKKEFDDITEQYNNNDIDLNPMVLFYFIEEGNDILNKKILIYIRERYLVNLSKSTQGQFNKLPDGIAYSKWFLLLIQLKRVGNFNDPRLTTLFNDPNNIENLFIPYKILDS